MDKALSSTSIKIKKSPQTNSDIYTSQLSTLWKTNM